VIKLANPYSDLILSSRLKISARNMIVAFIKLRLMQFSRALSGLGLIRSLFLMGLAGFAGVFIFSLTSEYPGSYYVSGGFVLLIMSIQSKRPDKLFLKSNFVNYKLICFAEYLLLVSPALVFLVIHLQWIPVLILIASVTLLVHWEFKLKQYYHFALLQRLIPSESFEWKAGVRKNMVFLIPLWITGIGASFFTGSVPVVLFVLGIIPFSFYEKGEPFQMIIASELSAGRFLFGKVKTLVLIFTVISFPLITAFLIFHSGRWYIPLAEYFIFISLYIFLILTKYAFYEPDSKSPAAQTIAAIGILCGMIPVFLPVVWLLSVRFYFKSRKNLNFYLNDFN
jgi:hypothetical protein